MARRKLHVDHIEDAGAADRKANVASTQYGVCRSCCPIPFPARSTTASRPIWTLQPGDVVLVPLNRREEIGVVWDTEADDGRARTAS